MNQSDLMYLASGLLAVGLWACALGALWITMEAGYWVYCKITGKEY
jgi:hypothetical protein